MSQFTTDHVTVFGFVVEFQALNEIFVHSLVLVLNHLCENWVELFHHQFLFACSRKVYMSLVYITISFIRHCTMVHVNNLNYKLTLTLLFGSTHLLDGGQCWVHFQSTEQIAQVKSIDTFIGAIIDTPNEVHA